MITKKNNAGSVLSTTIILICVVLVGVLAIFFLAKNNAQPQISVNNQVLATTSAASVATTSQIMPPVFDLAKRISQPPLTSEADYLNWASTNTPESIAYLQAKWWRVQSIIALKEATDTRILEALLRAPRESFFPATETPADAYARSAVPIGYGQTMSGPDLVAHMTQAIDPQINQRVLEVGTGSGYQSSVLSELSNYVYTIEIVPQLAQRTDARYTALTPNYPEYANIHRENTDGYYGWAQYAPFDRIIVTAGIDHVPPELLQQLAPNGIMVIPVGPPSGQTVLKITKKVMPDGSINFIREDIYNGRKVIFVPFTSATGVHTSATQ